MPYGIMAMPRQKKRDRFEDAPTFDFGPDPEYPESQALTALREHYGQMPQRGDFQHSILDKIAVALTGAAEGLNRGAGAGIAAGQAQKDRSFVQAMQDFGARGQGLEDIARLEGQEGERSFRTAQEARRGREAEFDRSMSMRRMDRDDTAEDRLERALQMSNEDRDLSRKDREFDREERRADRAERMRHNQAMEARLTREMQQRVGPEKVLTPDQQQDAEDYALDRVLRDYPEFEKFTRKDSKGFPVIQSKVRGGLTDFFQMRGLGEEEQAEFDEFLDMVEQERDAILNNRADPYAKLRNQKPGVGAPPRVDYRDVFGGR